MDPTFKAHRIKTEGQEEKGCRAEEVREKEGSGRNFKLVGKEAFYSTGLHWTGLV